MRLELSLYGTIVAYNVVGLSGASPRPPLVLIEHKIVDIISQQW